jgi:hypothetical protein
MYQQKIFVFVFFAMFYIKNRITNDSYSRKKYLRAPFAENNNVPIKINKCDCVKRREIQTLHCSNLFNAYSAQIFI